MEADQSTGGPWLPAEVGRALQWWSSADMQRLQAALQGAVASWLADWGMQAQDVPWSCAAEATLAQDEPARVLRAGAQAVGRLWLPADAQERLLLLLFPNTEVTGSLALAAAAYCLQDGAERISQALGLACSRDEVAAVSERACSRWSGALLAQWPKPWNWRLLLDGAATAAWRQARRLAPAMVTAPLANACDALAKYALRLDVELDGCELALGELQQLRAGDVVRVRHRLDQPASVKHAGGDLLFHAHLGRQGGASAVELASA